MAAFDHIPCPYCESRGKAKRQVESCSAMLNLGGRRRVAYMIGCRYVMISLRANLPIHFILCDHRILHTIPYVDGTDGMYSTQQMLRISCFWPDWNSYLRLGVSYTSFSTKRSHSHFSPKSQSQILNYQILNICRLLYNTKLLHMKLSSPTITDLDCRLCFVLYDTRLCNTW